MAAFPIIKTRIRVDLLLLVVMTIVSTQPDVISAQDSGTPVLSGGIEFNELGPFFTERQRVEDLRYFVRQLPENVQTKLTDKLSAVETTLEELIEIGSEYIAALDAAKQAVNYPNDPQQRQARKKADKLGNEARKALDSHHDALRELRVAIAMEAESSDNDSNRNHSDANQDPILPNEWVAPGGSGEDGLIALAAEMDRIATEAQDRALLAVDKFIDSAAAALKKELEFLAQDRSQKFGEPGKPLAQIIDYLKSDYNENDRRMYEDAVKALEILKTDPARFWGEHLIDAASITAAAAKLRIDNARKAAISVKNSFDAKKQFDDFVGEHPVAPPLRQKVPVDGPTTITGSPKSNASKGVKQAPVDKTYGSPNNAAKSGLGYRDFNPAFGLENCFPVALAKDLHYATGKKFAVPPVPPASADDIATVLKAIYGKQAVNPLHGPGGHLLHSAGVPVPSSRDKIISALRSAGIASRGLVFVSIKTGTGKIVNHVFNARNVGKRIQFWDAQVGLEASWDNVTRVFFYRTN